MNRALSQHTDEGSWTNEQTKISNLATRLGTGVLLERQFTDPRGKSSDEARSSTWDAPPLMIASEETNEAGLSSSSREVNADARVSLKGSP
jgi:hypothetical protein